MLENLKEKVYVANLELPKSGLVILTWGNVSAIDRENQIIAIKPSGVEYDTMKPEDMVLINMEGQKVEGKYKPSSDLATHLELYKAFEEVGCIIHTHSYWATVWSQAGKSIPCLGTTHADYFYGEIPITLGMTDEEINGEYEKETGNVIIKTFENYNYRFTPAVLVKNHGPFVWGKDIHEAVHNAIVLEEVAKMAYYTLTLNASADISKTLMDKHFYRKHGENAYYGQ